MISLAGEQVILLRDVPKRLPTRPGGRRLHISAVYRWVTKGVGGTMLESVRLGGATYTSVKALQRFAEAQSRKPQSVAPPPSSLQARHRHQRTVAAAVAAELGIVSG